MSGAFSFNSDTGCLQIRGELTIYQANAAVESLRHAVASGALTSLDLSGVTELDTAGLQWLLLAQRLIGPDSRPVVLVNHSEPVREVLELAGRGLTP
ncbi:MAG: STAS domain-containing protein [Marinobacter sp.]